MSGLIAPPAQFRPRGLSSSDCDGLGDGWTQVGFPAINCPYTPTELDEFIVEQQTNAFCILQRATVMASGAMYVRAFDKGAAAWSSWTHAGGFVVGAWNSLTLEANWTGTVKWRTVGDFIYVSGAPVAGSGAGSNITTLPTAASGDFSVATGKFFVAACLNAKGLGIFDKNHATLPLKVRCANSPTAGDSFGFDAIYARFV